MQFIIVSFIAADAMTQLSSRDFFGEAGAKNRSKLLKIMYELVQATVVYSLSFN